MEINEVSKTAQRSFKSFLSDKPMWVFWIAYTLLCGILFGIFFTTLYFMAQLWWVPVIVVVVIGMLWGTLAYPNEPKVPKEKKPKEKKS
ncbi:MAG: hypothetical protein PF447_14150 [Spirochaetaceae bacterium]|jgi:uncharacterized protein YneF (UPF0154 family)|nr:hypothetical protein [Spirochaetaceae bacterium]